MPPSRVPYLSVNPRNPELPIPMNLRYIRSKHAVFESIPTRMSSREKASPVWAANWQAITRCFIYLFSVFTFQTGGASAQSASTISINSLSPNQSQILYPGDRVAFKSKVTVSQDENAPRDVTAQLVINEVSDQGTKIFTGSRRSLPELQPWSLFDLNYDVPRPSEGPNRLRDSLGRKVSELQLSAVLLNSSGNVIARSPPITIAVKYYEIAAVTPAEQRLGSEQKVRIVVQNAKFTESLKLQNRRINIRFSRTDGLYNIFGDSSALPCNEAGGFSPSISRPIVCDFKVVNDTTVEFNLRAYPDLDTQGVIGTYDLVLNWSEPSNSNLNTSEERSTNAVLLDAYRLTMPLEDEIVAWETLVVEVTTVISNPNIGHINRFGPGGVNQVQGITDGVDKFGFKAEVRYRLSQQPACWIWVVEKFTVNGEVRIKEYTLQGNGRIPTNTLGGIVALPAVGFRDDLLSRTKGHSIVAEYTLVMTKQGVANASQSVLAKSGPLVVRFSDDLPILPTREVQLLQILDIPTSTGNDGPAAFKVEFVRMADGLEIRVAAEVLEVRPGFITVRVPLGLVGRTDVAEPPNGVDNNVRAEILRASDRQVIARQPLILNMYLRPLIVDELVLAGAGIRNLPEFLVFSGAGARGDIQAFAYIGRSTDGMVGLRVLNSALGVPTPLFFDGNDVVVFEPGGGSAPLQRAGAFTIPNLGTGNRGVQFNVSKNGLYVITIGPNASSPGPFPAVYQLHLAGNVGLPRKLINGTPEAPRGTRLDTLFNHPAPRPQDLLLGGIGRSGTARTALFKFANVASISPFARAVLIPPITNGTPIVRGGDPPAPLELTTPTARTLACATPGPGMVIDFTQIPDPASVSDPSPLLAGSVCAVIGQNDGKSVTLPMTLPVGLPISSLILDMGSGHEIVDGSGADFEVLAASGSYTVRVGNTPFSESFLPVPPASGLGPFTGVRQIDLATVGLTSARYVEITAAPSVVLDAVRGLNLFADEVPPAIGPITHVTSATITARRSKAAGALLLDPFIQLIAPNGDLFAENEAGFGDDLSLDLSDAAVINRILPQDGFYRYLVKGFDKQPDGQSSGAFFTRLETAGNYDQVELAVSDRDEASTVAQKRGTFSLSTRQRDSYLFQAAPGQTLNIVVNATGNGPKVNPVVELYDPEDFLIAANDDFPGRERNAAFGVTLPPMAVALGTYRIVVSAVDGFSNTSAFSGGTAHIRKAATGGYELKVFTGLMTGPPLSIPDIDIQPTTLDFANIAAGQSKDLALTISNKGGGVLRVSSITPGNAQVTIVSPAIPFDVAAGSQQAVIVRLTPLGPGLISASLSVGSDDPDEKSFSVAVTGRVATQSQPAQARLTSLSPRFQRGSGVLGGETYFLSLGGLEGADPPNGELAFDTLLAAPADLLTFGNDPNFASHVAFYTLKDSSGVLVSEGDIQLHLPPVTDLNHDGMPDFFDVAQAVTAAKSKGEFFDFDGEGSIDANWNRAKDSGSGTCVMHLNGEISGLPVDFDITSTFELIVYEGAFTYKSEDLAITGPVELSLAGVQPGPDVDRTLQTSLRLTRQSPEALLMQPADWTNESAGKYVAEPFGVTRFGSRYATAVAFDFGGGKNGYLSWIFALTDSSDADGDGVPDLSDDPGVTPPPAGVETWRKATFPADVLADAGKEASVWGDRANPDGDLLPNLLEYLTGSSPLTPDSGHLRSEVTPAGLPALVYRQAKNAPGVEAFPEWTPSLGAWRRDQVVLEVVSETADAKMVRASFPALATQRSGFARLAAEKR